MKTAMRDALRCLGLLALGWGLVGCGDALVDGGWRGEPLFTVTGWVHLGISPEEFAALEHTQEGELRTALFWAPTRGSSYSLSSAVEQDARTIGSFPARFELTLYEPPDPALLHEAPDSPDLFAVGLVVAYRDLNGNGRWDRDAERLVGGAHDRFVVYAPNGLESGVFGTLAPGFHRVVPATECDLNGTGTLSYAVDTAEDVVLLVGRGFPAEVILRLDCEGRTIGWDGACPPLNRVRMSCGREGLEARPDPMCLACQDLLAPLLGERDGCREWLEACLQRFPATECQGEARLCLGDDSPEPPPEPEPEPKPEPKPDDCDLSCMCQRRYEWCLDEHRDRDRCRQVLEECLAQDLSSGRR